MPRTVVTLVILTLVIPFTALSARGAEFSAEEVDRAIDKAVEFLWSQQGADGSFPGYGMGGGHAYPDGPGAMAIYALLEAGVDPQNPRMEKSLKWLEGIKSTMTYSLGIRCNIWEIANRKTDFKYGEILQRDAELLVKSTAAGSYTYASDGTPKGGDNSNSQYGLLGAWGAARGNIEIPEAYWWKVMRHWLNCQHADGGWGYNQSDQKTTPTMAAAGVASLYVCVDNLLFAAYADCNPDRGMMQPIERGLEWFEKNFPASLTGQLGYGHGNLYYYIYGVERVGLASGMKYFGTLDWYKMGAKRLISMQGGGGSWSSKYGPVVDTSYALLFLCRGRNAVLFNKLQRDGDWRNRPRDLASVTTWISNTFEKTVNWQIINTRVPVTEWHDAPILYISGAKAPQFSEAEMEKLRTFVWQGGTIFSVVECDGREFRQGIRDVYAKLFPDYEMVELSREHPLYKAHYQLSRRPNFYMIDNGVRPLVVHVDDDMALEWQLSRRAMARWAYEAAANLFMYITDRGELRPRGAMHWPNEYNAGGLHKVTAARVQYTGHYDPEPLALKRFALLLGMRTGVTLDLAPPVALDKLGDCTAKIAFLTGTRDAKLSPAHREQIRKYAESGGTLIIDAAGGDRRFHDAMRTVLEETFGFDNLVNLSPSSKIYIQPDRKIEKVQYRRATLKRVTDHGPHLRAVLIKDRPAVLLSREDITFGLLGVPSYGVDGYKPDDAYALLRNIVFHVAGMTEQATPSAPMLTPATRDITDDPIDPNAITPGEEDNL